MSTTKIVLIGCGKTKQDHRCEAQDMYTGSLFKMRRRYAETSGCAWWIISARYGLIRPEQEIAPYDETITQLLNVDRAAWYVAVTHELLNQFADRPGPFHYMRETHVEIHAGSDYADNLCDVLIGCGLSAGKPLKGMGLPAQMRWYKDKNKLQEITFRMENAQCDS